MATAFRRAPWGCAAPASRPLSGGVPSEPEAPDIERKLVGDQKPRGWGLFLIKNMVDSMDVTSDGATQTVTLTMAREERSDG